MASSNKRNQTQLDLFDFDTPSMPKLDLSRCYAREINYETAAHIVKTYHYAHRVPPIVVAIGMYVDDVLAGCITYGTPATANTRRLCGEIYAYNVLELNRLFVFDWAGRNSESWLIGQSFNILRMGFSRYNILVSYADADAGHTGYIYQATNWLYTGETGSEKIGFKINGKIIHRQTVNDLFGTSSTQAVQSKSPNAVPVYGTNKYRYVYFLGNRRERRELRKALKWPVLPYPKES